MPNRVDIYRLQAWRVCVFIVNVDGPEDTQMQQFWSNGEFFTFGARLMLFLKETSDSTFVIDRTFPSAFQALWASPGQDQRCPQCCCCCLVFSRGGLSPGHCELPAGPVVVAADLGELGPVSSEAVGAVWCGHVRRISFIMRLHFSHAPPTSIYTLCLSKQ